MPHQSSFTVFLAEFSYSLSTCLNPFLSLDVHISLPLTFNSQSFPAAPLFLSLALHLFFHLHTYILADRLEEMWATRLESNGGCLKSAELVYTLYPHSLEMFKTFPRANLHHECRFILGHTYIHSVILSLLYLAESNSAISRFYSTPEIREKVSQNPWESNKYKEKNLKITQTLNPRRAIWIKLVYRNNQHIGLKNYLSWKLDFLTISYCATVRTTPLVLNDFTQMSTIHIIGCSAKKTANITMTTEGCWEQNA